MNSEAEQEQTEVISRLFFTFYSQITGTFSQIEHLHFPNTFSCFFHSYDITSLGNIHPITSWKYTKHTIKVSLKISVCYFKNIKIQPFRSFCKAFMKLFEIWNENKSE